MSALANFSPALSLIVQLRRVGDHAVHHRTYNIYYLKQVRLRARVHLGLFEAQVHRPRPR